MCDLICAIIRVIALEAGIQVNFLAEDKKMRKDGIFKNSYANFQLKNGSGGCKEN